MTSPPPPKPDEDPPLDANPFWHLINPMPRHATLQQRLAWHRQHARHCRCLPLPPQLTPHTKRRRRSV